MSEQGTNLRQAMQIVRRHRILVSAVAVVGLIAGVAYSEAKPPLQTSEALVVIPQTAGQTTSSAGQGAAPSALTATQVVVAGSDSVLAGALPKIVPQLTLEELRNDVTATSLTPSVITITGQAKSGTQAESIANAVAKSYVAYVSSSDSPVGSLDVRLFQSASQATGPGPFGQLLTYGFIGLLAGGLIAFVIALALGRKDRRLRSRDEIGDSIGVPVLASFPVGHPTDPPGWTKLLDEYTPATVHAWRMRKLLEYLGIPQTGRRSGASSLTMVSLSSDRTALAIGPQLASYTASLGIPTTIAIGQQQDLAASAALRAVCAAGHVSRTRVLRTAIAADRRFTDSQAALTIMIVVLDAADPRLPEMVPTGITLLGVTAGALTAEQLATVATVAAEGGFDINGILVADPEPTDQTTGRVPQLRRSMERKVPTRTTGVAMEMRQ
ncbi:MAG TPA: Wzz/FepE/Etk N-terminal domain-containing protein [Trebonia sp.]|jgi:capsular polysaccharide biosynthesis protein|nr:Wzz/FepE/Etk N-terminal domain-containing protein [Trebonia sp.]